MHRMKGIIPAVGCLPLLFALSVGAVTVSFKGNLLDSPCQIAPGSLNQNVQFRERPVQDFHHAPGKGAVEGFSIRLINCNTKTLHKTVKLVFTGAREGNMTGQEDYFLKVSGVNAGKLAIGILDTDGATLMKLGEAHNHGQGTSIDRDTLLLNFKAYVQATPEAIAKKSVQAGIYESTANFNLTYE